MYSPSLARFISQDPKGYIDGMNLYAYVKNNPLKYLDAMGTIAQNLNNFENTVFENWQDDYTQSFTDDYGTGIVHYDPTGATDDYVIDYTDLSGFGNSGDANYIYNGSEVRVQENDEFFGVINDKPYEFTIEDSHLPQDLRDPDRLVAQSAYRSLAGAPEIIAPIIEYLFPLYALVNDDLNIKAEHQHMWWSDNYNVGFHENEAGISEVFREKAYMREEYHNWSKEIYEGDAMKASESVTKTGIYDLIDLDPRTSCNIQNNCQNYVDRLIDNYNKMVNIYE